MKTKKTYCLYAMVINSEVDGKDYVYIGSGDKQEPTRRAYDVKNMHFVNQDIWDIGPKGDPVVSVLLTDIPTKKMATSVENELVRAINNFPKKNLLLNKYHPRQQVKYGRNSNIVRFLVTHVLFTIGMFGPYEKELESKLEKDDFKVMKVLFEIGQ